MVPAGVQKISRSFAVMAASRFEYDSISWSAMESNNTERWWNLWSMAKTWDWLPPVQQLRHRRGGDAIFLGDGMTNIKYSLIHHGNMDLKPTWKLYLATCLFWEREDGIFLFPPMKGFFFKLVAAGISLEMAALSS